MRRLITFAAALGLADVVALAEGQARIPPDGSLLDGELHLTVGEKWGDAKGTLDGGESRAVFGVAQHAWSDLSIKTNLGIVEFVMIESSDGEVVDSLTIRLTPPGVRGCKVLLRRLKGTLGADWQSWETRTSKMKGSIHDTQFSALVPGRKKMWGTCSEPGSTLAPKDHDTLMWTFRRLATK